MMGGMPKKDAKPEDPIHNILKHQKEEREAQGESTQVGKMAATGEGKQATFEAPSSSGRPQTPAPSLFGRATKGYIAFDIATGRFVFLKDSWRSENQTPEYQTHKRLQDASVHYIATLLHGGDLRSGLNGEKQKTRTSVVLVKRPRIHTRLVSKEIGEPLSKARKSKDLTAGLGKAVIGNQLSCFAFFR